MDGWVWLSREQLTVFLEENTFMSTAVQEESGVLLGNARYEGFIPDMVDIISKVIIST